MAYFYFFLGLTLSTLIFVFLFILLIRRIRVNRARENQHKYSFLMPSVITLILVALALFEVRPRLMDLVALQENSFHTFNFNSADVTYQHHKVKIGGEVFYWFPGSDKFEDNALYRIKYTPYSKIIMSEERLPEPESVSND